MRGITKRFPGVVANDGVNLDLKRGEVHAILGENGAGKSTLMNVLYGLYQPDEGEILLNGKPVTFSSAKDAIRSGIGMVHQHFMLIPVMTVAENIVLANEPTREGVFFDHQAAEKRVAELSRSYKLAIDPEAKVLNIGVGQEQRVEILKALYRAADVLILDEPTAVLTPQEAGELFEILHALVREGMTTGPSSCWRRPQASRPLSCRSWSRRSSVCRGGSPSGWVGRTGSSRRVCASRPSCLRVGG